MWMGAWGWGGVQGRGEVITTWMLLRGGVNEQERDYSQDNGLKVLFETEPMKERKERERQKERKKGRD